MALAPFFKLNKNKSFSYTPRYYDERKEALEKRIAEIKKEMGIKDGSEEALQIERKYSSNIKGSMKSRFRTGRRAGSRTSNIRLLVIFLALLAIAYFIIYH